MQRVAPVIRDSLGLVEEALWETFLPSLFQVLGDEVPGIGVTCLHLGRGPTERGEGREVLLRNGVEDRYWKSVPWGFRRIQVG